MVVLALGLKCGFINGCILFLNRYILYSFVFFDIYVCSSFDGKGGGDGGVRSITGELRSSVSSLVESIETSACERGH